jgi:hypothetical protein
MNNHGALTLSLAACTALFPGVLGAEQPEMKPRETNQLNRFSFDARLGFNITARFKNLGRLSLAPNGRTTPSGDPYNYEDGYVLRDVSGNYGGQTWYWGYDQPGQISGNTILLSRNGVAGNSASPAGVDGDDANLGAEFTYNRELGRCGRKSWGIEAAANYLNVCFDDRSSFAAASARTADAYPFTPGTTPPLTPPPYQGSYGGAGFVIGDAPVSSSAQFTAVGATVAGRRRFDADVWGFRLGPYGDYALSRKWNLSLSAGVAAGLVNAEASWDERVSMNGTTVATGRGQGSDLSVLWGGYVSGKLAWRFSQHWKAEAGAQFQTLSKYERAISGRTVELDLRQSLFVVAGFSYSF